MKYGHIFEVILSIWLCSSCQENANQVQTMWFVTEQEYFFVKFVMANFRFIKPSNIRASLDP